MNIRMVQWIMTSDALRRSVFKSNDTTRLAGLLSGYFSNEINLLFSDTNHVYSEAGKD